MMSGSQMHKNNESIEFVFSLSSGTHIGYYVLQLNSETYT